MGAKEEGKFQRDLNSELGKTATAYDKIKSAQQDILFFARDYADEAKKAVKEIGDGSIAASETAKAFRDVASAAKGITDNYAEVLTGEKTFKDNNLTQLKKVLILNLNNNYIDLDLVRKKLMQLYIKEQMLLKF